MKLSCAGQSRGARNQNKSKIGGPGEVHFIEAAALTIQVKGEARCPSLSHCLCVNVCVYGFLLRKPPCRKNLIWVLNCTFRCACFLPLHLTIKNVEIKPSLGQRAVLNLICIYSWFALLFLCGFVCVPVVSLSSKLCFLNPCICYTVLQLWLKRNTTWRNKGYVSGVYQSKDIFN